MGLFDRWKNRTRNAAGLSSWKIEALQKALAAIPGLTMIADSTLRHRVTIGGLVTETISHNGSQPQFRVRITDGTGDAVLLWNGRESIPGLQPEVFLEARGTLGVTDEGDKLIIDPKYSIQVI